MGTFLFTHYHSSLIAIALFLIYAVSFFLYKAKHIRVTTHRKIWNVLLLGTFLVTAGFGLTLVIRRDNVLNFGLPFNLLFWHVEAGVTMTLISLFHLSWHFTYYRDLLRKSRERSDAANSVECGRSSDEK